MHDLVFFHMQKEGGDHDSPRNGSPTWENQNKMNTEAQGQAIPLAKSKPSKKK
jgi:hypothetical protein